VSINRRGALATLFSGIFAPYTINEVGNNGRMIIPKQPPGGHDYPKVNMPTEAEQEANYFERQRMLESKARGEWNEYELEELENIRLVEARYHNIKCLKSVSKSHKFIMQLNLTAKRREDYWKKDAAKSLERHIKNKFNWLKNYLGGKGDTQASTGRY
jgi:hypothetical protein